MLKLPHSILLHLGMEKYIKHVLKEKAKQAKMGRRFNYAVFQPSKEALELLEQQVHSGLIKPKIRKVYELDEAVAAHEDVEQGHGTGKVVFRV